MAFLVNTEIPYNPPQGFVKNVNFEGKTINITNNIDLSTINGDYTSSTATYGELWDPIGWGSWDEPSDQGMPGNAAFYGTFDGNGYTVSGLANKSLFGMIKSATIKNLATSGTLNTGTTIGNVHNIAGVVNEAKNSTFINLKSDVNLVYARSGAAEGLGGIVGYVIGDTTIERCEFNGTVTGTTNIAPLGGIVGQVGAPYQGFTLTVSDSANYAYLLGYYNVGDQVGATFRTSLAPDGVAYNIEIKNSVNYGNISVYADAAGERYGLGGLLGASWYNNASIPQSVTIDRSANYGNVTGNLNAGGLVGTVFQGNQLSITNSYNRGDVTSTRVAGGIVGNISNAEGAVIKNTYDTGIVGTGTTSGGFAGIITGGAVDSDNNYYLETAASGAVDSAPYAGVTAESEAYMKTLDFVADLGDAFYASADDYPVLWPSEIEPVYELIGAVPSASVKQLNGSTNDLTVTVTETFSNGIDGYDVPTVITFSIKNNAAGTYDVGGYKVYVDTKGNTQVRECYIVK